MKRRSFWGLLGLPLLGGPAPTAAARVPQCLTLSIGPLQSKGWMEAAQVRLQRNIPTSFGIHGEAFAAERRADYSLADLRRAVETQIRVNSFMQTG